MIRGKTEVETLRLNGWGVGDVLEGDEGYGPDRIWITKIGDKYFGCRWARNGAWEPEKFNTTLTCREWQKVTHVEPEPPAWDGSGLPPVGWSGEYKPCWHACEVVAYHKGFAVVWDAHDLEYFRTKDPAIFRPIRSKKDRAVEEMAKAAEEGLGHASGLIECMTAASGIYCAIRDGRVPGVTLEETS